MQNELHQKVFEFLEAYRALHPDFVYWLRERNDDKLSKGMWFQGNEGYAFVGLYNRGGGIERTRSIGLVFFQDGDKIECRFQNVFKGEEDSEIISFYSELRNSIGGFEQKNDKKFHKQLSYDDGFNAATSFLNNEKIKIDALVRKHNLIHLFITPEKFSENLKRILEYQNIGQIKYLIVNISWNSNDWQEPSQDKSGHKWVNEGNIPHESWNFDFGNERNTPESIKGYAVFTNPPKVEGENNLIIFYSDRQIVGFYGKAQILKEQKPIDENYNYNLIGDRNLCVLLKNKIINVKEKGYLEDNKRIGQVGFSYLEKDSTVQNIISEAIKLNPEESEKLNNILNWMKSFNKPYLSINDINHMNIPLNQILFGPPGTGKTYNSINKALEIIGENTSGKTRQEIKEVFDAKMKEGQIVFTTFHQSMSYEDFIEGIKPIEPEKEGDPVIYKIVLGIFRSLCVEASFSIAQLRESTITDEVLDFSILYDNFAESTEEKILNGQKVELETKTGGSVMVESISQQGNFIIKHHDGTRTYTVSKARLTKLQSAIKNLDDISNINDQFREIIGGSNSSAYWSVLNAIRKEKPPKTISKEIRNYTFDEKKEVVLSLSKPDFKNKVGKPYVLIIDEINRGNVSQIFGELISLIEEDKRLGKLEALEATLPYSKEKFGVPPNLYIIGTMNTADRSVEALDSALRRRFSFEEMPPKPSLIATHGSLKTENGILGNIDLLLLLRIINKRIEKLLDKDHQIGHSYFMTVSNLDELKLAFQKQIIPLLQEYFFGDFGKIGLVLGQGFFEPSDRTVQNLFADFGDYDASEFSERPIYKIKDISTLTEDEFNQAIAILLKN